MRGETKIILLFGSATGTGSFFHPYIDGIETNRYYGFRFRIVKLRFTPVGLEFPVTALRCVCHSGKAVWEKMSACMSIWLKPPGWQITIFLLIEELFFQKRRAAFSPYVACLWGCRLVTACSAGVPGNSRQQKGPLWFLISYAVMKELCWEQQQRKPPPSGGTSKQTLAIATECLTDHGN